MKKILFTAVAALGIYTAGNATYLWNWSHGTGGGSGDRGKAVSNPVNNSIAATGFFQGTVDFRPGSLTWNLTSSTAVSSPGDMYITNYNTSTGALIWARLITGTGTEEPMSILTNPVTGNIYVCGRFSGTCDFDPTAGGTYNLSTTGFLDYDGFLACYTNAGLLVWAIDIGSGSTGRDAFNSVTFDQAGNLMTCGEFTYNVDFNPLGTATVVTNYGPTNTDGFIAKYSPTLGTIVGGFAYPIGGTNNDVARGVCVDPASGNIYCTGWYEGSAADFDPFGSAPFSVIASSGAADIFTVKYTGGSAFGWVKSGGTTGNMDYGNDIMFYGNSVIITGGVGLGTASFGSFNWPVTGVGKDAFLTSYDPTTGAEVWIAPFIGTHDDMGQNIASDNQGYVYCTGYFGSSSITFYDNLTLTNVGPYANMGAAGTTDIFYARYNTAGHTKDIWTTGSASHEDCPGLFAWRNPTSGANEMFVTGSFSLTTQFDPASGAPGSHTSLGARDIFLAKYNWTTPIRMGNPDLNSNEFNCYPNPTNGTLNLQGLMEYSVVEMYSLDGKLMNSWTANTTNLAIDVAEFTDGVYLLRVTGADGEIRTEKVVVRH